MDSLAFFELTLLPSFILRPYTGVNNARTDGQASDFSPPVDQADFSVSWCAETPTRFECAVMMPHHLMYPKAEKEFRSIVVSEPDCAMAHIFLATGMNYHEK